MYPNQKIQGAFGDIFTPNTSATDKLAQQIFAQEAARKAQEARDAKQLDDEFAKNLSGVWDADVPEIVKKYGDWKVANIQLMKKKNASPKDQMEVLQKKADMYNTIAGSKTYKERHAGLVKQVANDSKGVFADDAAQQLIARHKVPSWQQPTDDSKLLYPYSVPDFAKSNEASFGKPTPKQIVGGKSKLDPAKDEIKTYSVGNNPNQMFDYTLNDVATKNKGKNYAGFVLNSMSDAEKEDITNKFLALTKDPTFIEAYGEVKPFSPLALSTDLGKAVALQTMKNFVNAGLPDAKVELKTNDTRKRELDYADWLKKNAITDSEKNRRMWDLIGFKTTQGSYQIDNIPDELKKNTITINKPGSVLGIGKIDGNYVDITDFPTEYKADIFGSKSSDYSITIDGRKYLKELPNGNYAGKMGYVVTPKQIINNTAKRTTTNYEKPIGTGKATIRKTNNKQPPKGELD